MAIFNSYVSLPEGNMAPHYGDIYGDFPDLLVYPFFVI